MKIYVACLLLVLTFVLTACGTVTDDGNLLIRSADPGLSFLLLIPQAADAPPLPVVEPDPIAIELEESEADDQDCVLKGNISGSNEKILHQPGGAYYSRTRIDLDKGEKWFCDIASAEAEGWRLSER